MARRAVFICICKFDTFFVFGFTLQFVVLVLKQDDVERWLTIAAAPVTLGILAAGFVAARREIKWLMATFVSGCVLGMGYFAFKLFRIFQNTDDRYSQVKKSLTTFSVISLIALLATVLQAMLVFRNFGKGLKFHMTLNRLPKHSVGGMGKPSPGLSDSGYLSDGLSDQGMHYKLESAASACAVFSGAVLIVGRLTDEHRLMRTTSCTQRILSGLEGVYSVHFKVMHDDIPQNRALCSEIYLWSQSAIVHRCEGKEKDIRKRLSARGLAQQLKHIKHRV
jgi:hypothetical protein